MLFVFAISCLLASALAHGDDAHHNELKAGSAVDMSVPVGSSACAVTVVVPSGTSKPGCKLRFRYDFGALVTFRFTEYEAWVKKDGNGNTWTDADKKTFVNNEFEIDCADGDHTFGLKVNKCPACIGAASPFWLSATIVQDGVPVIQVPAKATEWYGSTVVIAKDKAIVFKYSTDTPNQIAHFMVDKSASSFVDKINWFAGNQSVTPADLIAGGVETPNTVAGTGATFRGQISHATPGDYQLVLQTAALTGSTELTIQYRINSAPDSGTVKLAKAKMQCPQQVCSSDALKQCSPCTKNGCSWCGGVQNECVPGSCNVLTDLLFSDAKCPDIEKECKALKTCKECVGKKGCLFCDTGATIGISTGTCTSGVDNLGQQCNILGTSVTKTYKKADECPGAASSLILSLATLFVAVLTVF